MYAAIVARRSLVLTVRTTFHKAHQHHRQTEAGRTNAVVHRPSFISEAIPAQHPLAVCQRTRVRVCAASSQLFHRSFHSEESIFFVRGTRKQFIVIAP